MSEVIPIPPVPPTESLTKIEEWLSGFSKDSYAAYAKIDSVNERVRTLTPPMTALGVGYVYEATHYIYQDRTADTLFFYVPLGIGVIFVILAIFVMLWALVGQQSIVVLEEADAFLKAVECQKDKGLSLSEIENSAIQRRCESATKNLKTLKKRGLVLTCGACMAIAAFGLLILATPMFVVNQITHKPVVKNEQR